jgi:hypothetical protein
LKKTAFPQKVTAELVSRNLVIKLHEHTVLPHYTVIPYTRHLFNAMDEGARELAKIGSG